MAFKRKKYLDRQRRCQTLLPGSEREAMMRCSCGAEATLRTPDYGYGYGAEYVCSQSERNHGNPYGHRFMASGLEAQRDSRDAFAQSKANAEAYRSKR